MSYSFLDAQSSVQSAESSVVSGTSQRQTIAIGSVLTVIPVTLTGNPSVSGQVGASVIGTVPVTFVNSSISGTVGASIIGLPSFNASGSVVAFQGAGWSGSVAALITNTNVNVSGSVAAFQAGTQISSISGTIVVQSIVGTYLEGGARVAGGAGLFTLGLRNDAVASIVSANLNYTPTATDSAGRITTKPFAPEESRVEGYNSVVSTSVTTLVGAAGAGLRNYVTDFLIANTGSSTTLVTFKDGLGSILGYTIAPTGGGSNATNFATPIRTGANATFDFQAATASSVLYVTVKGFKAP